MTWHTVDLSELIAKIESGGRPHGGASVDSGEIPSLGGENIRLSGGLELEKIKKVPLSFFDHMTKGILQNEDVLINKDGANTGKVGFYENQFPKASINEHVFLLRGHPLLVEQRYLYYLLLSQYSQGIIRSKISGSAQPGLKRDFIKNFSISIPISLTLQSKICEVFNTIDLAIDQTNALIEKQNRIKTGVMQNLLTMGIDKSGQLRNVDTDLFKPSTLGSIPEEWDVRPISEVAIVEYGISSPINRELREGIPIISLPNVDVHGNLNMANLPFVKPELVRETDILQKGDILFNWRNGSIDHLGKTTIFKLDGTYTHVGFLLRIRAYADKIDPDFLFAYLRFIREQGFFRTSRIQVNNTFNSSELKALEIKLPRDVNEQKGIADIITKIILSMDESKKRLEKLKHLKNGLMQSLLSGDIAFLSRLTELEG